MSTPRSSSFYTTDHPIFKQVRKQQLKAKSDDLKRMKSPQRMQRSKTVVVGRQDKYGNLIRKGGKNHKIKFSANLEEIFVVENWKQYYNKQEEEENFPERHQKISNNQCCILF